MPEPIVPPIDYSSKDYASFREDMINAISTRMPEWTGRSPGDFGILLIEAFAYLGDTLSFYGDRIANEAFLDTAVLRSSVLNIARMLDYRATGNVAATVTLQFTTRATAGPVTIPAGTRVSTVPVQGEAPIVFETNAAITIADVAPNTGSVAATHGETVTGEGLGSSDGTFDQAFALFNSPVIEGSQKVYVNEGAGAVQWLYIANLIDAGPGDNVYTTVTDENNVLNVLFGDNVNGRIPPNGAVITADYRVGGGVVGNVGAATLTVLVTSVANVIGITNPAAAQGGADAETLDQIRVNAPRALTTLDRAVTLGDYANLALKVAGIAKTKAQATVYTNINLFIAPYNGAPTTVGGPANNASTNLRNTLLAYLADRKMVNATITLLDPTYVAITVTVAVNVLPNYNREVVRLEVDRAIKATLAFDNVDFGHRVTLSQIYKAIMATPGVDYGVVSVLSRTGAGLGDVVLADNEIPYNGTITVTATGGITTF